MKLPRWAVLVPGPVTIILAVLAMAWPAQAAVTYIPVPGANSTYMEEIASSAAQQEQNALAAHNWRRAEAAKDRAQEARQDARQEARQDAAAEAQLDAVQAAAAAEATQDRSQRAVQPSHTPSVPQQSYQTGAGDLSFGQLESLWTSAGGPGWAASSAASVAECESGGNPNAYNPSGASGLWQILGQVVGGNIFSPMVNALNAVAKFTASGDTWAQWVCQP